MRTMYATGGIEPPDGKEVHPYAGAAAGDTPADSDGHADRRGDTGIPPDLNVDNPAGWADGSANVDVGDGWLDGWDPFNVDNVSRRTAAPANVDKGPGRSTGRRLGPMPYHPRQPRPRVPLPEVEPEPQGTLADGLEPVSVDRASRDFWAAAARSDEAVRVGMSTLGKALAALRSAPRRTYAARTMKEYERAMSRMAGRFPDEMAPACSKRSAYLYRAALVHDALNRRLPKAVDDGRRAAAGMDAGALLAAAGAATEALAVLERYPPDRGHATIRSPDLSGTSFYESARAGLPKEALAPAKPGMSRRSVLARFPDGWRRLIWKVAAGHRRIPLRHVAAVAVLTVAGLRPQEIHDGIFIDATNAFEVRLTVLKPAKGHGGRYGLGPRTHVLEPNAHDDPASWLRTYAKRHGGSTVVTMKRRHLARLVGALSRQAMPSVDPVACPYDYRHQASADVKQAARRAFPDDAAARQVYVAERMGHSAARSQRAYGTAAQSRGGLRADKVEIMDLTRRVKVAKTATPMPSAAPKAPQTPGMDSEGLQV